MAKTAKTPANFEAALAELETIIQTMENGELPLEAALTAYKDGIELMKFCQGRLADAEQQLKVLEDGELKPMELKNGG